MDKNLSRCPRLAWWQDVVDELGDLRLRVDRPLTPLEKFTGYFRKNLAPSLALVRVVVQSLGVDFVPIMLDVLDEGESRIDWKKNGKRDLGLTLSRAFPEPSPKNHAQA